MATTHAALGVLTALVLLPVEPSLAPAAALAAYAGGLFPDLDVAVVEHRKTLHFPEFYPLLAVAALAYAALAPSTASVGVAFFLLAAALHCLTEVFGGGLGLRPWLEDDDRGVYYHLGQRWLPPRRIIPYDGSPRDLVLCALATLPGVVAFDGWVRNLLLAGFAVSVVYTALRKRLVEWSPDWLLGL
ncbi:metal-dependent hydrolase [Halocalculus aciditolerans]|uniref:Metal-dependent hydrolase n=1 Tax=Halocalculus aciditolerans TaxID=1383812 RepID=A0A830FFH6_9EURY|nr:metal-dependent hydrolase [Halocalculus aciditolerans]GGL49913.1 hypothetical protein GCM10009039_05050 [Halocalculus aciditolerans]